jgi:hypothetical protein
MKSLNTLTKVGKKDIPQVANYIPQKSSTDTVESIPAVKIAKIVQDDNEELKKKLIDEPKIVYEPPVSVVELNETEIVEEPKEEVLEQLIDEEPKKDDIEYFEIVEEPKEEVLEKSLDEEPQEIKPQPILPDPKYKILKYFKNSD